jgi:hypothetical protein
MSNMDVVLVSKEISNSLVFIIINSLFILGAVTSKGTRSIRLKHTHSHEPEKNLYKYDDSMKIEQEFM